MLVSLVCIVLVAAPFFKPANETADLRTGSSAEDRELYKLRTGTYLDIASAQFMKQQLAIYEERCDDTRDELESPKPNESAIAFKVRMAYPYFERMYRVYWEQLRQDALSIDKADLRVRLLKRELKSSQIKDERKQFIERVLKARETELDRIEGGRALAEAAILKKKRSTTPISMFNWDGACVLNTVHLAVLNLDSDLLTGRDQLSKALTMLKKSSLPTTNSHRLRYLMGSEYRYVTGGKWGGTCLEPYLERFISRIPKLKEACSCVVQNRYDDTRQSTELVHYLIACVPATLDKLLVHNSYKFLTLPEVLIFSIQQDWFEPSAYLTGDCSEFTLSDLYGRSRKYRLRCTIDETAVHVTLNMRNRDDGTWYKIDNSKVRKIKSKRAVNPTTNVFFFEAMINQSRKRAASEIAGVRTRRRT